MQGWRPCLCTYCGLTRRRGLFYESLGFRVDKEESSNTAHYRGHCLDGIEGRGRTLLLRNDL